MIISYYILGLLIGILIMTCTFLWAKKTDYYSGVDVAWSYSFACLATLCLLISSQFEPRQLLITAMIILWSLRLGTHLAKRLASHFPNEDGRYITLRKKFKDRFYMKFYFFYLFQAVSLTYLSAPLFFIFAETRGSLMPMEMIAFVFWLMALIGETLADHQLKKFKTDPANKGQVCNVGLWKYSRHPNYFFEWLIWCSFALFATASPFGWISWYAPFSILYLLLKFTGIPANEEQSLKSKGDLYRHYQRTTSVFIPWFPKKLKP